MEKWQWILEHVIPEVTPITSDQQWPTPTSYVVQLKHKVGEKCVPDWEAMSLQSPYCMEKKPDFWPSTSRLWHRSNFDHFMRSKVVPFCLHMSVAGHKAISLADILLFFPWNTFSIVASILWLCIRKYRQVSRVWLFESSSGHCSLAHIT